MKGWRPVMHDLVHLLYDPLGWGRKAYRVRYPRLHVRLIPGSWLDRSCQRFDRYLEGET